MEKVKFRKRLYTSVLIAAVWLISSCVSERYFSGYGDGWYTAGCADLAPVGYLLAVVGVFRFSQNRKRFGPIASMTHGLGLTQSKNHKAESEETCQGPQFGADTDEHYQDRVEELQDQVQQLEVQLQLSHRQQLNTEAIIYSIWDAVIVIDEYDKLLMANEAAGKLFEFDWRDSQYSPIYEVIDESHREFINVLQISRQSRVKHKKSEIEIIRGDQSHTFDCSISCIFDDNKRVCGAVAVLHDITREKEVSRMKNDFISHVSHELKTPLASITAYSEMLVDGEIDDLETRNEFYGVIQSQAERLNLLIEDILNTSRIESGLIKVNKEPLSLTILIQEQLKMIRKQADEKNISLYGPNSIVHDRVCVDKGMIQEVIVNLLSNAVKYTQQGGSINIECEVDEPANVARVSITDTGVGIPPDKIDYVFDKFYRVTENKKYAKGTGLGLNLVKQIVEKIHNGRVFIQSEVGRGSTFGFEVPLDSGRNNETNS